MQVKFNALLTRPIDQLICFWLGSLGGLIEFIVFIANYKNANLMMLLAFRIV